MDFRDILIAEFTRHCEATGLAPSTVSTKAANDGKFYDSLVDGAGFTMQRYEKVMQWFKDHTPVNGHKIPKIKVKKSRTN